MKLFPGCDFGLKKVKVHHVVSFSETFTSLYDSTHTVSLCCSPVEANRQIHTIHSQLRSAATKPQAAAPPPATGPLFSDIQREFQKKEAQETVSLVYLRDHFQVHCYFRLHAASGPHI